MTHHALTLLSIFILTATVQTTAHAKSTKDFLKEANLTLLHEVQLSTRADWVQSNFITDDTTAIASETAAHMNEVTTKLALDSKKYKGSTPEEKRQLDLLFSGVVLPAPADTAKTQEMSRLKSELESAYGSGKYCNKKGKCLGLQEIEEQFEKSRNPAELLELWNGWHAIAPPMKAKYQKIVELGNQGAKELGYKDMADLWKAKYDMPPAEFEKNIDNLWGQVQPFYEQLHCYVRTQLNKKYGDKVVSKEGPIPAHLLGNMWAQSWTGVRDVIGVNTKTAVDVTKLLKEAKYDSKKMVRVAENFFVSLGMPKLPPSFYEKSLFEKPRDREVVCHASAWDFYAKDDVRIKMCIRIDEDSFRTIHHELGHIYYYLGYKDLPFLFTGSANDGFHEAIGDTIQLSITNQYLKDIGLLKTVPKVKAGDMDYLLNMALEKVAFLPFGLLIDKWRWQVFSGAVPPAKYNDAWWDLRKKYQGMAPPNVRGGDAFDPGAKYHVPAYVPYSRYFISHILQFQFHRALCKSAGYKGPLHECSIYNNKEAGQKFWAMLKLGASKPWPEALQTVTGTKEMDATAMREYFGPLEQWLREKNKGQKCGW